MGTSACDPPPEDREPSGGTTAGPAGHSYTKKGPAERWPSAPDPDTVGLPPQQSQAEETGVSHPIPLVDLDWSFMDDDDEFSGIIGAMAAEELPARPPTPPEMELLLHAWLIVQGYVLAVELKAVTDDTLNMRFYSIPADVWHERWSLPE